MRKNGGGKDSLPVRLSLMQEEIGETIGATRESVARVLSEFSKRQMLLLRKLVLWIEDRSAQEKLGYGLNNAVSRVSELYALVPTPFPPPHCGPA
jgi:Crp-like helix-turn-helix protein